MTAFLIIARHISALNLSQNHSNFPWLLILSWLVLVPILYSNYRQAFVVSSNMNWKYKKRFGFWLAITIASVVLSFFSIAWATLMAGVPAGLVVLYFLLLIIAFMTAGGSSWH
jgi:uncharacterized membrane protein